MKKPCQGYALLMLLLALAVISLAAASYLQLGQFSHRRQAELELLEKGAQMEAALDSYAKATRLGQTRMPQRLEDLLRDPRYPKVIIRHLRQIEVDPITGKKEWGLIWSEDGKGIVAVHSLSEQKPVMTRFSPEFASFKDLPRYADWVFGQLP